MKRRSVSSIYGHKHSYYNTQISYSAYDVSHLLAFLLLRLCICVYVLHDPEFLQDKPKKMDAIINISPNFSVLSTRTPTTALSTRVFPVYMYHSRSNTRLSIRVLLPIPLSSSSIFPI